MNKYASGALARLTTGTDGLGFLASAHVRPIPNTPIDSAISKAGTVHFAPVSPIALPQFPKLRLSCRGGTSTGIKLLAPMDLLYTD